MSIRRLATATGMTEGQAYTLLIGLVLALTTAAIGIPPTLRDRVLPAALAAPPAAVAAPVSTAPDAGVAAPASASPALEGATPSFVPSVADRLAGASSFAVEPAAPAPAPAADPGPSEDDAPAEGGKLGDVEMFATAPGGPHGIAVDGGSGAFYVATARAGVVRFGRDGRLAREYPVDGPLTGVHLDGDRLVVLRATGAVLVLDTRSGRVRELATITAAVPGATPKLHSVVAAPDGGFLVSDSAQGVLWLVTEAGEVSEYYRGPELVSPDGGGPAGLVVEEAGSVLVAVSRSAVALTGAVVRVTPGGAPESVYRSLPGASLAGLAVDEGGRIYVAATGGPGVVVLEADGTEVTTVEGAALAGPVGLALRDRSLLVTNGSGTVARLPLA